MIFNNVKKITIPEGNVKSISCGGNVIWKEASENANLISFTIAGTSYQAVDGMTWVEWVDSEYNTGDFYIGSSNGWMDIIINGEKDGGYYKCVGETAYLPVYDVYNFSDKIKADTNYYFQYYEYSNGGSN